MADLLDIAPSTAIDVVKIDGRRIEVGKLSVDGIAAIVARFPELASLLDGSGGLAPRLITRFGSAIGPIIAAGCGHPGDEQYEEHAAQMLIEHQLMLLKAIIGLTFPNGLSPVMEAIAGLVGGAKDEPKTVKARLRKSPSPSPLLSDEASHPIMQ